MTVSRDGRHMASDLRWKPVILAADGTAWGVSV